MFDSWKAHKASVERRHDLLSSDSDRSQEATLSGNESETTLKPEDKKAYEFWSAVEPNAERTEASYEIFLSQLDQCNLSAEVRDVMLAWDIEVSPEWQNVIDQSALQADGVPDFTLVAPSLPQISEKLTAIYEKRLEMKKQYNENVVTMKSEHFGDCEVRLLRSENYDVDKSPIVLMPGCLTGAVSLENVSVALALGGRPIVTCDTAAPNPAGFESYQSAVDIDEWETTKTAVNAAYTESVGLAKDAYENGYNVPNPEQEKYVLLGYSTSAAAVLQAAILNPEKVDKVALLCPIGLNNEYDSWVANVLKILVDSAKHTVQNALLGEKNQNTREYFTGYIERQKIRGWSEVPAIISNAALADLTEAIYQVVIEHDIPVTVLLGGDDKLFDPEVSTAKIESMSEEVTSSADFDTHVLGSEYTHNHIGRDPEMTARLIEDALKNLERMNIFQHDTYAI